MRIWHTAAWTAALALLPLPSLTAQSTWIVDASNGPGTHFVDLAPALASPRVVDGDIVRMRPGIYFAGRTSKALRILGQPGVRVIGVRAFSVLEVFGIPAGRAFSIRQVEFGSNPGGAGGLILRNNDGSIHLDEVSFTATPGITVFDCDNVTVNRCTASFGGSVMSCFNSRVVLSGCNIRSTGNFLVAGSGQNNALFCQDSDVTVHGGTLTGGRGLFHPLLGSTPPSAALRVFSGRATVTGGAQVAAGGADPMALQSPTPAAVIDHGVLALDPSASLMPSFGGPATAVTGQGRVVTVSVPSVQARAQNGIALSGSVRGRAGDFHVLLAGLAAAPTPGGFGVSFLDPSSILVLDAGVLDPQGTRGYSVPLPAGPFDGLAVTLQSLRLQSGGSLLSAPAVVLLD